MECGDSENDGGVMVIVRVMVVIVRIVRMMVVWW